MYFSFQRWISILLTQITLVLSCKSMGNMIVNTIWKMLDKVKEFITKQYNSYFTALPVEFH